MVSSQGSTPGSLKGKGGVFRHGKKRRTFGLKKKWKTTTHGVFWSFVDAKMWGKSRGRKQDKKEKTPEIIRGGGVEKKGGL